MSNKKIFKEMYSSKINKNKNYQEILKKINNQPKRTFYLKKILIPITSILLIFTLIYINTDKKTNTLEDTIKDNKDYNTYTSNNTNENSTLTKEITIEKVKIKENKLLKKYNYLKEINIPNNLKEKEYHKVYLKDNEKNKYIILNNYEIKYQDISKEKTIILSFSDKYIPLRTYYFNDNEKKYHINNQEITIYKSEYKYLTTFKYNNINFDIETNNITEEELLNLIKSIMK